VFADPIASVERAEALIAAVRSTVD
jgi:hypothetical protein